MNKYPLLNMLKSGAELLFRDGCFAGVIELLSELDFSGTSCGGGGKTKSVGAEGCCGFCEIPGERGTRVTGGSCGIAGGKRSGIAGGTSGWSTGATGGCSTGTRAIDSTMNIDVIFVSAISM